MGDDVEADVVPQIYVLLPILETCAGILRLSTFVFFILCVF